jgi:hypothetical protein
MKKKRRKPPRKNPAVQFIDKLPPRQKSLARHVRTIVRAAIPEINEGMKWKIPFYSFNGILCFINPVAEHIVLGFCYGAQLSDEHKLLSGNGKLVRHLVIKNIGDIQKPKLRNLLHEAMLFNVLKNHKILLR